MTRTNNHDKKLWERLEEDENDILEKEKSATDAFEKEELRSQRISNDSREQDRLLRDYPFNNSIGKCYRYLRDSCSLFI
ncbi:MAG: hypothetical protein LBQ08_00795 [Holosporaceae bacterium]|jgi:hypothetical protein|nr:hypothetical protein [Holosporaceae bacterium]